MAPVAKIHPTYTQHIQTQTVQISSLQRAQSHGGVWKLQNKNHVITLVISDLSGGMVKVSMFRAINSWKKWNNLVGISESSNLSKNSMGGIGLLTLSCR
jgi:hypothetical protein